MNRISGMLVITFDIRNYDIALKHIEPACRLNNSECRCEACWAAQLIEFDGCKQFLGNCLNCFDPNFCRYLEIKDGQLTIWGEVIWHADDFMNYNFGDMYLYGSTFDVTKFDIKE